MANHLLLPLACATLLVLGGCDERQDGPLKISAIGTAPELLNPNLHPLTAPSATMLLATAQGLVRFDASGQIEPGLAQSWIVSDDGLRYTFRLHRTQWQDGGRISAAQVVERLRAAASGASRNPLKSLLGAIDEIEAMTDDVLEISLVTPRPNFLQLLAQPELAILREGHGSGPYRAASAGGGAVSLYLPGDGEEDEARVGTSDVLLRGEAAALAITRFMAGDADLVIGGDASSLPLARAARPGRTALRFDPARGLFGLSFGRTALAQDDAVRRALTLSVDRAALAEALGVPIQVPRDALLPAGVTELPDPARPGWTLLQVEQRRAEAIAAIAAAAGGNGARLRVRVAMPDGPGYRLVFAHLRRDWRAIGVDAERVSETDANADLRFVDQVAAIDLATWYLRQFTCDRSAVCDPAADALLAEARRVPAVSQRQALLAQVDRMLTTKTVFIPLGDPVRWSLVSPRLTGFAPNVFAHHNIGELIAERQ